MQGADTNANSNGPKRQRMKMCAVSVLLFLFSLLFGVRTKQLCSCFVAFVFAVVASVFDAVVFARSLARSLSPFLFQLDHNEVLVQMQTTA